MIGNEEIYGEGEGCEVEAGMRVRSCTTQHLT